MFPPIPPVTTPIFHLPYKNRAVANVRLPSTIPLISGNRNLARPMNTLPAAKKNASWASAGGDRPRRPSSGPARPAEDLQPGFWKVLAGALTFPFCLYDTVLG